MLGLAIAMPQKLSAGKTWVSRVLEELGHSTGHEWGSPWDEIPKGRRSVNARATEQQLILTSGSIRKVVWLSTEDLRAAGAKDEVKRAVLRESLAEALSELLERAG